MGNNDDEKLTLAGINPEGVGDDVDTKRENDQEEKRAVVDNANTSADPIRGEMISDRDNADKSEDNNQEKMMGLRDNTHTSTNMSQKDAEKVVEKANDPRVHSVGYDGVGFSLWEVAHALADGVLDENRMRRLKSGFLALLAALDEDECIAETETRKLVRTLQKKPGAWQ